MSLRAMPSARIAGSAEAPQSISAFTPSPTRWKQVLERPPEPNASPQPTNCRCIGSAPAAFGQTHEEPDGDNEDGAEQEVAPQVHHCVESQIPDPADHPLDALDDIPGIE